MIIHSEKGTQMDTLPSADDHYRTICLLLAEADDKRFNLADMHATVERIKGHGVAARVALDIWPGARENLERVFTAAQAFIESEADSPQREDAYERLHAAVREAS